MTCDVAMCCVACVLLCSYCGYGDNCKFMHDRGDYKQGWQLEKEWDEKQEAKKVSEGQQTPLGGTSWHGVCAMA